MSKSCLRDSSGMLLGWLAWVCLPGTGPLCSVDLRQRAIQAGVCAWGRGEQLCPRLLWPDGSLTWCLCPAYRAAGCWGWAVRPGNQVAPVRPGVDRSKGALGCHHTAPTLWGHASWFLRDHRSLQPPCGLRSAPDARQLSPGSPGASGLSHLFLVCAAANSNTQSSPIRSLVRCFPRCSSPVGSGLCLSRSPWVRGSLCAPPASAGFCSSVPQGRHAAGLAVHHAVSSECTFVLLVWWWGGARPSGHPSCPDSPGPSSAFPPVPWSPTLLFHLLCPLRERQLDQWGPPPCQARERV